MSEELKLCPFCGKEPILADSHPKDTDWVRCSNNQCYLYFDFRELEQWNSRPIEDALRKQLEEDKHCIELTCIGNTELRAQLAIAVDALKKVKSGKPSVYATDYALRQYDKRIVDEALAEIEHIRKEG